MSEFTYYVLLDWRHKGKIIKWSSEFEGYEYIPGVKKWYRSDIMYEYFPEDDP